MIKKDYIMYDDFVVLDESDDPVTGLTTFTKILYDPDKNEVSGSITITIEELGDGLYRASFTPNKLGSWTLIIYNEDYFPWGKGNDYICVNNLLDDIPGATWDELLSEHNIYNTFGEKNQLGVPSEDIDDYKATGYSTPADIIDARDNINDNIDFNEDKIDNILTSLNLRALETTAQAIKAKTDKLLFDIDNYVRSHLMATDIDTGISEADMDLIVDKTWDEQTTDHEISGSTGAAIVANIPESQAAIINEYTLDSGGLPLGIVVDDKSIPVGNTRVGAWNLEAGENGLIQYENLF